MRRLDHDMLDPDIAAALDAIDATLAGDPVDPEHAELAELALLIAAERPAPEPEFAASLDEKVVNRFARSVGPAALSQPRRRRWAFSPMLATAGAGVIAVVVVVSVGSVGGVNHASSVRQPQALAGPARTATTADASKQNSSAPPELHPVPVPKVPLPSAVAPSASAGTGASTASVQPPTNGRKVTQSAAIDLGAPADRVDDVAQGVFNVVGRVGGIVDRSSVTATGGSDGSAQFQLRVPSSELAQTMTALSKLKYGHVLSRTDNSQDINSSFVSANRRLADATAVRTALLGKLAAATSQQEIASLKAQIRDAEMTIARAKSDLRTLNRQVNFSQISVTIQASSTGATGGGGFSLHTAAHDALKVLTVAAGVALISLAALVPLGLLGALGWWIATTVQRRRREQALDLA